MLPAVSEVSVGPCLWLQWGSSNGSQPSHCPLALAKLYDMTEESCQADMRCWMQPSITQVEEGENTWAARHPPCKDHKVCWSAPGNQLGDEMVRGKGGLAAGKQVMPFVFTLVNSHGVLVSACWLTPTPGRLQVGCTCSNVGNTTRQGVKGFVSKEVSQELPVPVDTGFSWRCCLGVTSWAGVLFSKITSISGQVAGQWWLAASKAAQGTLCLDK